MLIIYKTFTQINIHRHPLYKYIILQKMFQGVKWEDTSKKEENEDIFPEKEDKGGHFSLKLIQRKQKKYM